MVPGIQTLPRGFPHMGHRHVISGFETRWNRSPEKLAKYNHEWSRNYIQPSASFSFRKFDNDHECFRPGPSVWVWVWVSRQAGSPPPPATPLPRPSQYIFGFGRRFGSTRRAPPIAVPVAEFRARTAMHSVGLNYTLYILVPEHSYCSVAFCDCFDV